MNASDPHNTDHGTGSAHSRSDIESGLEVIRADVNSQLRRIGTAVREIDVTRLPRFGPDLPEELPADAVAQLEREIAALEPWLQGPFLLAGNLVIPGVWSIDGRWAWLEQNVPDVTGKRVLDVGTNAGYDAFMFKLKGAAEVVACEPYEFIEQARFLESIYHSGVDFQQIGWRDLDPAVHGRFDLVHCHGVLYHEPHPMALLQKLRSMVSDEGELWFGSIMHASAEQSEYVRFVPDSYAGDRTWWFVPGRLAMRWMLEVVGFEVAERMLTEGVRGEFPTISGYFCCRPTTPDSGLGDPLG
jgi:2-polyprenyl-3-methyl-5-hydroxy-6-metoxy-1,4-benzoquinol methylase